MGMVENIVENGEKTAFSFSWDVFKRLLSWDLQTWIHRKKSMDTTCIHAVACVLKARLNLPFLKQALVFTCLQYKCF